MTVYVATVFCCLSLCLKFVPLPVTCWEEEAQSIWASVDRNSDPMALWRHST